MEEKPNTEELTSKIIELGAEIAGGTSAAAVGLLLAGPPGAIIGAVGGPLLTHSIKQIASELKNRFLGKREEARIGATLAYAITKIDSNLKSGKKIRSDDFFNDKINERSASKEILEGTLLAAQKEHEEKKLKYYGNLVANLSFDHRFDKAQANFLLKISENLTYRQLCILSMINEKEKYQLRDHDYRGGVSFSFKLISLLQEIFDLYNLCLVAGGGEAYLGFTDVNPTKIELQGSGNFLLQLMEINNIPEEEKVTIVDLLK